MGLLFVAIGCLRPRQMVAALTVYFRAAMFFHLTFAAYILVMIASSLIAVNIKESLLTSVQATIILVVYFGTGARLLTMDRDVVRNSFVFGGAIGVVAFIAYCQYVFSSLGTNLFAALNEAFRFEGSQIAARTIKKVVNYQGDGELNTDAETAISGSIRNGLAATLAFFFFAAWSALNGRRWWNWPNLAAIVLIVVAPAVMLVLISRSNFIALIAGVGVAITIILLAPTTAKPLRRAVVVLGVFMLVVATTLATGFNHGSESSGLLSANWERLSLIRIDPRLENYNYAIEQIRRTPIIGRGPGAMTPDGLTVHNLIVAGWYECGILGLIASIFMFASLVYMWLRNSIERIMAANQPIFHLAFATAIMVGPVIRRMISGNGGRFLLVEVVAVAFFLAFLLHTSDDGQLPADDIEPVTGTNV
jgi:hypothetical protein